MTKSRKTKNFSDIISSTKTKPKGLKIMSVKVLNKENFDLIETTKEILNKVELYSKHMKQLEDSIYEKIFKYIFSNYNANSTNRMTVHCQVNGANEFKTRICNFKRNWRKGKS